jgi:hypothetical protein
VRAGTLLGFEFVSESSGGIIPLNTSKEDEGSNYFKGRRGSKSSSRSKVQKGENWFYFTKTAKEERTVEILLGELVKLQGP